MFFDHLINEQNTQAINEAKVYAGKSFSLHVVPESGFNSGGKYAYFKYLPMPDKYNDKDVLRISFREPTYIEHYVKSGKRPDKLNAKQRKELVAALLMPNAEDPTINNYQALIYEFNYRTGNFDRATTDTLCRAHRNPLDPTLPPNFVHINYPMPDYTQLK